jgi:hypothetical protein
MAAMKVGISRRSRRRPRRLLGLALAVPLLVAQCAPPPPAAPPGSWSYLATSGSGYTRWCKSVLRYEIDTTVVPSADERGAIFAALAIVSRATGITFEYAGDHVGATPSPGVDAVIGYRDFPGGTYGIGGGSYTPTMEMVVGEAYVQAGLTPKVRRATLLHEIAHMLGLGHVQDINQLMYPTLTRPPRLAYGNGDAEGLRRVGASVPCAARRALSAELQRIVLE